MYNKYAHSRVVLKVLWCMHCLRVSTERPTDPAVAFYIKCQCSANGSSKCALCEGNRQCERVSGRISFGATELTEGLFPAGRRHARRCIRPILNPQVGLLILG